MPMGFCYPGTGKTKVLPLRPEQALLRHKRVLDFMPNIQLTLLIGPYAQNYYLKQSRKSSLTETVRSFEMYIPDFLPLSLPWPGNNIWQEKNAWFGEKLFSILKKNVGSTLGYFKLATV